MGRFAAERFQCLSVLLGRLCVGPDQMDDGMVRYRDRERPWLASAKLRQLAQSSLLEARSVALFVIPNQVVFEFDSALPALMIYLFLFIISESRLSSWCNFGTIRTDSIDNLDDIYTLTPLYGDNRRYFMQ